MNDVSSVIELYGMSKDPETNNYIIVMNYAENDGSLRNYLDKNNCNIPGIINYICCVKFQMG